MNRYFGLHSLEGEWHALLPRYVLLAERVKGRRVLDVGCGTGIGSSLLLELGAEMVDAIDHRPAVLELGRMKHARAGLDFHVMFWEELDFPAETFDVVVCLDPASPVTDPSLLQEVKRVLKPGGEYICAVERKPLPGIESVLPRYGYAESGEKIDLFRTSARVPQIGDLQAQFKHVNAVLQRPVLTFLFDEEPAAGAESIRRVDTSENSGSWVQNLPDDGTGRWIPADYRLCANETETGAISIYFCADQETAPAPLSEIHLPYYSLVERLGQVINDLQTAPMREAGDADSVFDEVIEPADERERVPTNEFKAVGWDDRPTSIRMRPDLNAFARAPQVEPPVTQDSPPANAAAAFETALEERDQYIEHLVGRIHEWETRYFEMTQKLEAALPTGAERVSALEIELQNLRAQQAALFEALQKQDDTDTGEHPRLSRDDVQAPAEPAVAPTQEDAE